MEHSGLLFGALKACIFLCVAASLFIFTCPSTRGHARAAGRHRVAALLRTLFPNPYLLLGAGVSCPSAHPARTQRHQIWHTEWSTAASCLVRSRPAFFYVLLLLFLYSLALPRAATPAAGRHRVAALLRTLFPNPYLLLGAGVSCPSAHPARTQRHQIWHTEWSTAASCLVRSRPAFFYVLLLLFLYSLALPRAATPAAGRHRVAALLRTLFPNPYLLLGAGVSCPSAHPARTQRHQIWHTEWSTAASCLVRSRPAFFYVLLLLFLYSLALPRAATPELQAATGLQRC